MRQTANSHGLVPECSPAHSGPYPAAYFGLRRLATLYGLTWTAYATAAALGSVLLGRAFDTTGSYAELLTRLAALGFIAGILLVAMPRYRARGSETAAGPIAAAQAAS